MPVVMSISRSIQAESNMSPKILLVDDDTVLAGMLAEYLETEGCEIVQAHNGADAVESACEEQFDIVVLDIMMPKLNGIEALKQIRASSTVPVIMLTARGDDLDRILGLELGADDYLPKPCNPRELYARIKAVLRRSSVDPSISSKSLRLGDLQLDLGSRKVTVDQQIITLTQTEFDLLWLLLSTPDQVVTKSEISTMVLDKPLSQWDRSIDVHISNMRKKLGKHTDGNERIKTLRGIGYLYVSPPL
jgi:two-component system response regulator CpxR